MVPADRPVRVPSPSGSCSCLPRPDRAHRRLVDVPRPDGCARVRPHGHGARA
jgi:hypothetical protein